MRAVALIVAGGTGDRFGRVAGKQLASVMGVPVLSHTVAAFEAADSIDEIVVVVHPDRVVEYAEAVSESEKVTGIVAGGDSRQASVMAGLEVLPPDSDIVVIHDGARPLIEPALVDEAVRAVVDSDLDGVVVGHPSYDTVKKVGDDGVIAATLERSELWVAQTPQVFRASVLREAYAAAAREGFIGTDDSSLVERFGGSVAMLLGPRDNLKLTVPEDLPVIERILESRARRS